MSIGIDGAHGTQHHLFVLEDGRAGPADAWRDVSPTPIPPPPIDTASAAVRHALEAAAA